MQASTRTLGSARVVFAIQTLRQFAAAKKSTRLLVRSTVGKTFQQQLLQSPSQASSRFASGSGLHCRSLRGGDRASGTNGFSKETTVRVAQQNCHSVAPASSWPPCLAQESIDQSSDHQATITVSESLVANQSVSNGACKGDELSCKHQNASTVHGAATSKWRVAHCQPELFDF